jgi:hypothetical protein
LKQRILQEVIPIYQRDNVKVRILMPDGTYVRAPQNGEPQHRCQAELLTLRPNASLGDLPSTFENALATMPGQIAANDEA